MVNKLSLLFAVFLFSMSFVYAGTCPNGIGVCDETIPFQSAVIPITQSVNYSQVNVNNSQFLQGLTPSQVANLFTETDPLSLHLLKDNWNLGSNWLTYSNPTLDFNSSKLTTIYYNATQSLAVAGTIDGGTLADTNHQDGKYDGRTFNFSEVSATPGLDLRINFTGITSFNQGVMRYKTASGLAGDYPIIQMWNYDTNAWEDYPPVAQSTTFATITQPVFDSSDHISGGVAQMRIYKATKGNTGNKYYVDWIAISQGFGTPSGEEVDPYSWHRDGNINATGYNITASYFKGDGSWLTGISTYNSSYVPYTGATSNVDLGSKSLTTTGTGTFGTATIFGDPSLLNLIVGNGASATGYYSIALGPNAIASDDQSFALGYNAFAGYYSIALGPSSSANGDYSIALGYAAHAPNANEISFSNQDSTYGTDNGIGGYTQLDIYNGVANFQKNSITTTGTIYNKADNSKHYFGAGNDASIYYDGTNIIFNTSVVGSGLAWFSNNISATGYITRTSVYDKSRGNALNYIKDANNYLTTNAKGEQEINHSAFYGYTSYEVTDFSKPETETYEEEVCDEKIQEEKCHNETLTRIIYPHKTTEEGVDLGKEIDVLRQSVYELKNQNTALQSQLNCIKSAKDFAGIKLC